MNFYLFFFFFRYFVLLLCLDLFFGHQQSGEEKLHYPGRGVVNSHFFFSLRCVGVFLCALFFLFSCFRFSECYFFLFLCFTESEEKGKTLRVQIVPVF